MTFFFCFFTPIINYQKGKLRKQIIFTSVSKRIKYQEINLTEEVKDLYIENYNTLLKEIEKNTNK